MRILEVPEIPARYRHKESIRRDVSHLRLHEQQEYIAREELRQTESHLAEEIYQSSVRDETKRLAEWLIRQRRVLDLDSASEFIVLLQKEDESKGEQ